MTSSTAGARESSDAGSGELHEAEVAGLAIVWRTHDPPAGAAADDPVLYIHGVPNASVMWRDFLPLTGGVALDLPGFGRSAKRGDFDYSIAGYAEFLEQFTAHLGLGRVRLVTHDWGTPAGLGFALRAPERVTRQVILDAVPLLPGYRWHPIARAWRRPVVGELVMGATSRRTMRVLGRRDSPDGQAPPDEFIDEVLEHFDQGTQRAILRLYRSAPEDALARAGAGLGSLTAPALVLWGEHDPYIPAKFARAYADALPNAEAEIVPGAGHWPWFERPEVVERVARFLAAE